MAKGPKSKRKASLARRKPDPTALSVEELAELLKVAPEEVAEHLAAGCPSDSAGRINLVHYAAWLVLEIRKRRVEPNAPA